MSLSRDALPVPPPHPGWFLRVRILPGLGLSVSQASRELRIARQALHWVLASTVAVSPEMAKRLAHLSCTMPHFWLGRQQQYGLWHAEQALANVVGLIHAQTFPPALQKRDRTSL
ncbi:HigA family addiction module antitoxin [Microvirga guangxiensis]|uniref:HigA family addiction module antitoxin n=1 Tax=Microvirga guangxiensis TaxID=549386 RepID=UPI000B811A5E|nr:HigA family addiction module antitoxin [Microvirga guangxiensis]